MSVQELPVFIARIAAGFPSPAAEFGPRALAAVRHQMVQMNWCRSNINKMVGRIKLMFRWASEQELISASVYHGLKTLKGLVAGRSEARETAIASISDSYIWQRWL